MMEWFHLGGSKQWAYSRLCRHFLRIWKYFP